MVPSFPSRLQDPQEHGQGKTFPGRRKEKGRLENQERGETQREGREKRIFSLNSIGGFAKREHNLPP
jgi:hypothetical protein